MLTMDEAQKLTGEEWELCEVLGRGSFGVVYRAQKEQMGVRTYSAVKVVMIPNSEEDYGNLRAEGYDEEQTSAYIRKIVDDCINEIKLMDSLKATANIVSIEDYKVVEVVPDTQWCILIRMELLTPLTQYKETHPLGEADIIRLGTDICNALRLCRARNIIHRDIKVANIFVNEFGDFKLGDFGIARRLDEFQNAQTRLGTLNFLAPEIYQGKAYDGAVDIYSLGMVLYTLGNRGRIPFMDVSSEVIDARAKEEANMRRLHGEALPLPAFVSPQLGQVICRACAYDPGQRFQSPDEMSEALRTVLSGQAAGAADSGVPGWQQGRAVQDSGAFGRQQGNAVQGNGTPGWQQGGAVQDSGALGWEQGNAVQGNGTLEPQQDGAAQPKRKKGLAGGRKAGSVQRKNAAAQNQQAAPVNVYRVYSDEKGNTIGYKRGIKNLLDVAALIIMLLGMLLYHGIGRITEERCLMGYAPLVFAYALVLLMDRVFIRNRKARFLFKGIMLLYTIVHAFTAGAAGVIAYTDAYPSVALFTVFLFLVYLALNRLAYTKLRSGGDNQILARIRMSGEKGIRNTVILMVLEIIMADVFIEGYLHAWHMYPGEIAASLLILDIFIVVPHIIGIIVQKLTSTMAISRKLQWINNIWVIGFIFLVLCTGNSRKWALWLLGGSILVYAAVFVGCIIRNTSQKRKAAMRQEKEAYIQSCADSLAVIYQKLADIRLKEMVSGVQQRIQSASLKNSPVAYGVEQDIVNNIAMLDNAVSQGAEGQQIYDIIVSLQYLVEERERMLLTL